LRNTYLFQIYFSSSTSPFFYILKSLSVFPPLLRWRVYFSNTLSPSISHFKKKISTTVVYYSTWSTSGVWKKNLSKHSRHQQSTTLQQLMSFLYTSPPRQLDSVLYYEKKSIILLVRIGEKSTITTTLGCKPLWCSLLCDDKERVCTASISGHGQVQETEPRRTGSHSVRHISGLPVSMAMPMLETLRYFYPNLSQLRRGRFCSFVFVIITNSLLLLLCRSDLIKDAVKKYDEKTKKSALLYSFYNQSSCFFI